MTSKELISLISHIFRMFVLVGILFAMFSIVMVYSIVFVVYQSVRSFLGGSYATGGK